MLMERGAQLNVRNKRGWTPLDYAYSVDMRDYLQVREAQLDVTHGSFPNKPQIRKMDGNNDSRMNPAANSDAVLPSLARNTSNPPTVSSDENASLILDLPSTPSTPEPIIEDIDDDSSRSYHSESLSDEESPTPGCRSLFSQLRKTDPKEALASLRAAWHRTSNALHLPQASEAVYTRLERARENVGAGWERMREGASARWNAMRRGREGDEDHLEGERSPLLGDQDVEGDGVASKVGEWVRDRANRTWEWMQNQKVYLQDRGAAAVEWGRERWRVVEETPEQRRAVGALGLFVLVLLLVWIVIVVLGSMNHRESQPIEGTPEPEPSPEPTGVPIPPVPEPQPEPEPEPEPELPPPLPAPIPIPKLPTEPPQHPPLCTSHDCVLLSGRIIQAMDMEVDPCEDFYTFSCGGWMKMNALHDSEEYFDQHFETHFVNMLALKHILTSPYIPDPSLTPAETILDRQLFRKVSTLYNTCMNASIDTQAETRALRTFLKEELVDRFYPIWDPIFPGGSHELNRDALRHAIIKLHDLGVPALFSITANPSPFPQHSTNPVSSSSSSSTSTSSPSYPNLNKIWISQPSFVTKGLAGGDEAAVERYIDAVEEVLRSVGEGVLSVPRGQGWRDVARAVVGVEKELEKVSYSSLDLPALTNIAGLQTITPRFTSWTSYFKDRFPPSSPFTATGSSHSSSKASRWKDDTEVVLKHGEATRRYLEGVARVVDETDPVVLEHYLAWTLARSFMEYASTDIRTSIARRLRHGDGKFVEEARWKTCGSLVSDYLPMATTRYFLLGTGFDPHFRETERATESNYAVQANVNERERSRPESSPTLDAAEITDRIRRRLEDVVGEVGWMDEETKVEAKKKLTTLIDYIAHPVYLLTNITLLASQHEDLNLPSSTFSSSSTSPAVFPPLSTTASATASLVLDMVAVKSWGVKRSVRMVLEENWGEVGVDVVWSGVSPLSVDAVYDPLINALLVPTGIIHPVFYASTAPQYLNYGAFGTLIGQALVGAIDSRGSHYNWAGYLSDWYTHHTRTSLTNASQCLISLYNNFTLPSPADSDSDIPEIHLNGTQTLENNIADAAGLRVAFDTWRQERKREQREQQRQYHGEVVWGQGRKGWVVGAPQPPMPPVNNRNAALPGFETWSPEQMFFVGYAQSLCNVARPEHDIANVRESDKAPNKYRVNGVLSQSTHFHRAYGCSVASGMRPTEDVCVVV
ncbi:hypothetical protein HK102_001280 [Quaeritorhiza haematococci]|nr:hypothetical protein HK102_001280 [Quaeritorhiza haematococci]